MDLYDMIAQLRVLLTEAYAYKQCGNEEDAAKMLLAMKTYLEDHLPLIKVYPLPNDETLPSTNGDDVPVSTPPS
ncbi:hypothetical protein ES707_15911 [subsurface metagenome]